MKFTESKETVNGGTLENPASSGCRRCKVSEPLTESLRQKDRSTEELPVLAVFGAHAALFFGVTDLFSDFFYSENKRNRRNKLLWTLY